MTKTCFFAERWLLLLQCSRVDVCNVFVIRSRPDEGVSGLAGCRCLSTEPLLCYAAAVCSWANARDAARAFVLLPPSELDPCFWSRTMYLELMWHHFGGHKRVKLVASSRHLHCFRGYRLPFRRRPAEPCRCFQLGRCSATQRQFIAGLACGAPRARPRRAYSKQHMGELGSPSHWSICLLMLIVQLPYILPHGYSRACGFLWAGVG